jgi:rubrerythrin
MALVLKGSSTEKNLLTAFSGESQAKNRYTFFAREARKEGYTQIAYAFEEIANQEQEHARRLFGLLEGGAIETSTVPPAGPVRTTAESLKASAREHYEWKQIYSSFARIAREEGFTEIAKVLGGIAVAEKRHEKRYLGCLANIESGTAFEPEEAVARRCRNVGCRHEGHEAYGFWPVYSPPPAHFEQLAKDW